MWVSPLLSYSHTSLLPYSHTLLFSYSPTLLLSYSPTLLISYSHTLLLSSPVGEECVIGVDRLLLEREGNVGITPPELSVRCPRSTPVTWAG